MNNYILFDIMKNIVFLKKVNIFILKNENKYKFCGFFIGVKLLLILVVNVFKIIIFIGLKLVFLVIIIVRGIKDINVILFVINIEKIKYKLINIDEIILRFVFFFNILIVILFNNLNFLKVFIIIIRLNININI